MGIEGDIDIIRPNVPRFKTGMDVVLYIKRLIKYLKLKEIEDTEVQYTGEGKIPSGLICMWSGLLTEIPIGWLLCDGNNNTPNLTNKFIYGTITEAQIGDTGGATTHNHTGPSHTHSGPNHSHTVSNHVHSMSNHSHNVTGNTAGSTNPQNVCIDHTAAVAAIHGHTHSINFTSGAPNYANTGGATPGTSSSGTGATGASGTGNTSTVNHLPTYYKMAFIIKE